MIIVTILQLAPMALVKGILSRFVWKMFFYKGLNKKSLLLEALTVSDLQRSLEAQAFNISLLKLFAVRVNYKRRMLRAPGNPGVVYDCHPFYNWHPWPW